MAEGKEGETDGLDKLIDFLAEKFQKELALEKSEETTAQVSVKPFSMDDLDLEEYDSSEEGDHDSKTDLCKKPPNDVEDTDTSAGVGTHDTVEEPAEVSDKDRFTSSEQGSVRKAGVDRNQIDGVVLPTVCRHNLDYYKILYRHQPPANNPRKVSIWVSNIREFRKTWTYAIQSAVFTVNDAAPGLSLVFTKEFENADLQINAYEKARSATLGSILNPKTNKKAKIYLAAEPVVGEILEATALHELMHALGFEHEHQRYDSVGYIRHNLHMTDDDWESMGGLPHFIPLTPYDYYSIMHYPVCPGSNLEYYKDINVPYKDVENVQLSELDKVALNYCYRPCITLKYEPRKHRNGMYYCGRPVMNSHNYPNTSTISACLQSGPNCPACRVLSKPTEMEKNQWQGWSGWVYCDNNGCGPHYGRPCDACRKVVTL